MAEKKEAPKAEKPSKKDAEAEARKAREHSEGE